MNWIHSYQAKGIIGEFAIDSTTIYIQIDKSKFPRITTKRKSLGRYLSPKTEEELNKAVEENITKHYSLLFDDNSYDIIDKTTSNNNVYIKASDYYTYELKELKWNIVIQRKWNTETITTKGNHNKVDYSGQYIIVKKEAITEEGALKEFKDKIAQANRDAIESIEKNQAHYNREYKDEYSEYLVEVKTNQLKKEQKEELRRVEKLEKDKAKDKAKVYKISIKGAKASTKTIEEFLNTGKPMLSLEGGK